MSYQALLNIAKGGTYEKVKIEGGQTSGHILFADAPTRERRTITPREELGVSYARKYREEDEMEDIHLRNIQDLGMGSASHHGIDDITSVGTIPNIGDLIGDELTQVYETYSFKHECDSQLLIHLYKEQIMEQIEQNPVVIIKGQTGCGKTTQVPQYILDSCRELNIHCNIVVTQPRKIAAISIAKRVCQERNWALGSLVGYQVSLDKQSSEDTRLLYCTAGVLLQKLIGTQNLANFTHIIVDEIHERDNETDFLLIVIKKFLRIRGNRTKVILMSATMNTDKFVNYFAKRVRGLNIEPPVIELEAKTKFPVQYFYVDSLVDRIPITMPLLKLSEPQIKSNAYELAALLVEVFYTIDTHEHNQTHFIGSVLIFLPGIHEIEVMYETLQKRRAHSKVLEEWYLCPLHSTITNDEQAKVFKPAPQGSRKIILATNIAESSITVPDVKYVIDFCLMKMQVQERDTSYTSLQLSWASKSQAIQRAGRVGRVMAGRVYRLVSQSLYEKFDDECSPEILRCPLETLVLKAKQLDIGAPAGILGRAMDPPDLSNILTTILNLKQMGALLLTTDGVYEEYDGDLTFIGRVMASLPIDPYLSKLIILGHMFSCLDECVIMASAMAVKSIFSTPFKKQLEAYISKLRWANHSSSDPIGYLSAYKLWRFKTISGHFKRTGGVSEEAWASKFFIQIKSLREVARLEGEITNRLKRMGLRTISGKNRVNWTEQELPLVLKVVLAGAFYPNYFVRNQVDEKEAIRVLGGRDPFSTVYLSNFPQNQPGPLYINAIKQHFHQIGADVTVSFDGSSKVYLTFANSSTSLDDKKGNTLRAPGTVALGVIKAVKLRHLQIPIQISVLPPVEARKRAKKIFGESLTLNLHCWNKQQPKPMNKTILPGLGTSVLPLIITHINSPGHFFCHINDQAMSQRHVWLNLELNKPENLIKLDRNKARSGVKCVASYSDSDDSAAYYRATILSVNKSNSLAQIIYIDYGNEAEKHLDELCDFSDKLIANGVKDEPPLALECTLAEIQPSLPMNPKGQWSSESTKFFSNRFRTKRGIALIYSVVNNVLSITMFKEEIVAPVGDLLYESSFNYEFVKYGYAEMAEEPYLSRENHVARKMAQKNPQPSEMYSASYETDDPYAQFHFDPPSETECHSTVHLKGPRSPLEMSLYSMSKKCLGKQVGVEWNSVNSVLIDDVPMDSHHRMMVAANVTQSTNSDKLTLRNTTYLPNMHGLANLITLIFAPKIELRTDEDREKIIGALCGLGFYPDTGESYYPENDVEFVFDTKFDLSDVESINKLRFWMNFIVGQEDVENNAELSEARSLKAQQKIKEYFLQLISKKRPSMGQMVYKNTFAWDQIPSDVLLDPLGPRANSNSFIYPLIWGVELNSGTAVCKVEAIKKHLQLLEAYGDGAETMKSGTKCELCEAYLDDLKALRLHLQTNLHKTNLVQFKKTLPAA